ncbi:MAG: hypothetical protein OXF76_20035 [Caldilineaceae bacterium]|nr:hypothetical protein [Caldilineaceae bacterium]
MSSLFDGISSLDSVKEIYEKIEDNCAGRPRTSSKKLWSLRRRTNMDPGNTDPEVLLERSVALLAQTGHMPGWYNQCPIASGIVSSRSDRRSAVDLVHWSEATGMARLVELKWESGGPHTALQQILQYGVVYILCRVHKKSLPLQNRCLMDAQHVALEVVAPSRYYEGDYRVSRRTDLETWLEQFNSSETRETIEFESNRMEMREYLSETSLALNELARSKTAGGLTMSLNALAFPEAFDQVPFRNGQDVWEKCSAKCLTDEAQIVRNAFAGLTTVWPEL